MKKTYLFSALLLLLNPALRAQFTNVQMNSSAISYGEVSIAMNPANTNQLVAGNNITTSYYSGNGGVSWTQFTSTSSSQGIYGDPAVACDNLGNFVFLHLGSPLDHLTALTSNNGGVSWTNGVAVGYNAGKAEDKEYVTTDRTNGPYKNNMYVAWAELDNYSSSATTDSSMILLSRSTNAGVTWTPGIRVSKKKANCGWKAIKGACPAVGPNGEIYVSWCGQGVRMNKSLDGGNTWMAADVQVDVQIPDWYFTIPTCYWGTGFTSCSADISNGAYKGNVYIAWADQRNGSSNTDCFVARSTNGGATWTTTKVNNDITSTHQFHPYITIDQTTGYVYVVFYDRRNYSSGGNTDVYLAWSTDGGASYKNIKINNTVSSYGANGDYIGITAHNNLIRPMWTAQIGGQWQDLVALIDYNTLVIASGLEENGLPEAHPELNQNYPNPFNDWCYVTFTLPKKDNVTVKVYNAVGEVVAVPIDDINYEPGTHQMVFYPEKYKLAEGLYYYSLVSSSGVETKKMLFSK